MTTYSIFWTLVLTTFYSPDGPPSDIVTKPFGDFVTESLCDAAIKQIDDTSTFAADSQGGWILTCDPPFRGRAYE